MLKLPTSKHHSILGIDLSASAVKVLEISGSKDRLCVEGYAYEPLPSNALEGNIIKDSEMVAQCIKKAFTQTKFTAKTVALAVSDSSVITKVVQLNDGLSDAEMEELVLIEADKYIPYPIDEVNLDFEVQGYSAKNSALLDVLIVASRAENVNSRADVVTKAGLEASIVDVESYAVERAAQLITQGLPAQGQGKIIPIVDIGSHYTHLYVLNNMKLVFSREEKFGGMQLIESIVERYNLSQNEAVTAMKNRQLPDDYEKEILEPFKEMVILQVKRTLQFYYSVSQHQFVDHIVLAGGLAGPLDLTVLIQEQLKIPATLANPFATMSLGKDINVERLQEDAPSLMVACGLALRNIQ